MLGHRDFDADSLCRGNYISTMSLIRTEKFPGFDESLKRFQDWDLWLTMLKEGDTGEFTGKCSFKTQSMPYGISSSVSMKPSVEAIMKKHKKWIKK
jgi:hypothetical protein